MRVFGYLGLEGTGPHEPIPGGFGASLCKNGEPVLSKLEKRKGGRGDLGTEDDLAPKYGFKARNARYTLPPKQKTWSIFSLFHYGFTRYFVACWKALPRLTLVELGGGGGG
jgi:hypothetical protein